jgi:hypothetical protein
MTGIAQPPSADNWRAVLEPVAAGEVGVEAEGDVKNVK